MILEVKDITKSYKNRKVLSNISFRVKSGDVFGIIGPNGAGKSTILKIILGLIQPDSGDIIISQREDYNNLFGALIDRPAYYEYLNGRENIEFFQNNYNEKEINSLLKIVGIDELDSTRKVKEYSLGMRQRLAIALALIGNKPIIVLDEPLNGLDAKGIYDIRKIILDLAINKGKIVIITSHILSEVEKVTDKIMIFNKGKTLFHGRFSELVEQKYLITFDKVLNEDEINLLNMKIRDDRNIEYKDNSLILNFNDIEYLNKVIAFLLENRLFISEVKKIRNSLEEYYFKVLEEFK